jgi:hypothetical protein
MTTSITHHLQATWAGAIHKYSAMWCVGGDDMCHSIACLVSPVVAIRARCLRSPHTSLFAWSAFIHCLVGTSNLTSATSACGNLH